MVRHAESIAADELLVGFLCSRVRKRQLDNGNWNTMNLRGCCFLACLILAPWVQADTNWPSFRGPANMGASLATGLPLSWSAKENLVWKQELPGSGASSPVVFGDKIFVTCYTGYFVPGQEGGSVNDLKRHMLALDRVTGKLLWDVPVPAKQPEEERIRDHGFAASTPAVDQERVYTFFGKTGVLALDHDGKKLWLTDVGSGTNGWGSSASPVLYKNMIFINASVESGSLVALDKTSGAEKWQAKAIKSSWSTPLVVPSLSGKDELVVSTEGKLMAFEPLTGKPLWFCATDISWYMVPSLVADQGIVYCLGGRSGTASLAVRTGGSGDVTKSHRLWTGMKGSNVTSPVFHGGHLYWMNDSRGTAYCAEAKTGEVIYEKRLNGAGQVYASPLLADGRVYYLARDGKTFVVAADPQFKELRTNDLRDGSIFDASPAVDGGRLLIRSGKFLYCIGK